MSVAARPPVNSVGYVLDASALLCPLFCEPGAERVGADSAVSTRPRRGLDPIVA